MKLSDYGLWTQCEEDWVVAHCYRDTGCPERFIWRQLELGREIVHKYRFLNGSAISYRGHDEFIKSYSRSWACPIWPEGKLISAERDQEYFTIQFQIGYRPIAGYRRDLKTGVRTYHLHKLQCSKSEFKVRVAEFGFYITPEIIKNRKSPST